jgi:hypothetical protein
MNDDVQNPPATPPKRRVRALSRHLKPDEDHRWAKPLREYVVQDQEGRIYYMDVDPFGGHSRLIVGSLK